MLARLVAQGHRGTWLHGALLLFLITVGMIAWGLLGPVLPITGVALGERFHLLLPHLLGNLYPALSVVAGITVGVARIQRGSFLHAVAIASVATVLMIAIDLVSPMTSPQRTQPLVRAGEVIERRITPRRLDEGGLQALSNLAWGEVEGVEETLRDYPPDHPRLVQTKGLFSALQLLFPICLVGLTLGVSAWLSDHVTFRSAKAERTFKLLLSWALVPIAFSAVIAVSLRLEAAVLFRGAPPLMVLFPAGPLLLIAVICWKTAWIRERNLRFEGAVEGLED